MNTEELPEEAGHDWMSLLKTLERDQILQLLSNGFCNNCQVLLENRIHSFLNENKMGEQSFSSDDKIRSAQFRSADEQMQSADASIVQSSHKKKESLDKMSSYSDSPMPRDYVANSWSASTNNKRNSSQHSASQILSKHAITGDSSSRNDGLAEDPDERIRVLQVGREKDFVHIESINGRRTNVLQGLELHTRVFNSDEQKQIVEYVYNLQRMGQRGQLRERTYSEPRKWMRGKGRITIQFGCCYNYAVDKNGNPPGIVRDEDVDPLPPLFKQMVRRMVSWHILPPTCIPDSCIVNIYDEGDCIPPHIDHHDFVRPFCTVSLLTECNILFGSNLKVVGPGEFSGPISLPLPVGSVLILNGNAADIAKHCIPGVPARRISITFRKMHHSKIPYNFFHDPELYGIKPFVDSAFVKSQIQQNLHQTDELNGGDSKNAKKRNGNSFLLGRDDFPPLGSLNSANRRMASRR